MIVLFRALTYGTLFVGLLLVFVPDRILTQAGIVRPPEIGPIQIAGMLVVVAGAALAIASVLTFAFVGKGTPAPFDPPGKLVIAGPYRWVRADVHRIADPAIGAGDHQFAGRIAGPYRWVRNPMYIGAGLVLLGAAMFYGSFGLALYTN